MRRTIFCHFSLQSYFLEYLVLWQGDQTLWNDFEGKSGQCTIPPVLLSGNKSTSSPLLVTKEQTHAQQRKSPNLQSVSLNSTSAWLPDLPRRDLVSGQYLQSPAVSPEPCSRWPMGYVRGLVTLTLVKEQLGVQFRQRALSVDQRLASLSVFHAGNLMNVSAKCCEVCPENLAYSCTPQAKLLHLAIETVLLIEFSDSGKALVPLPLPLQNPSQSPISILFSSPRLQLRPCEMLYC
ncbi:hypothetical protein PAMP_019751 [Pampus punctatissimus]